MLFFQNVAQEALRELLNPEDLETSKLGQFGPFLITIGSLHASHAIASLGYSIFLGLNLLSRNGMYSVFGAKCFVL